MQESSGWKEKVARSIIILLGVLVVHTSHGQDVATKKLSFSFKSTSLEKVIDHLSRTSGFHVIYSSDKIDVTTPVSLSVTNKTVSDILVMLEKQTNLSFRLHDRHIIIRPGRQITAAQTSLRSKESLPNTFPMVENIPSNLWKFPVVAELDLQLKMKEDNLSTSNRYVKNHLSGIQLLLDTTWTKKIPAQYIHRLNLNTMHSGWFVSAGPIVNDYSAGVEVQFGLKFIYAVYDASWLKNGQLHSAYGLGTSVPLTHNFSINPAYTYSGWSEYQTQINTMFGPDGAKAIVESSNKELTRHHQFKLLIQYSFSKNVRVQVGPVFSKVSRRYSMPEAGTAVMTEFTQAPPYSGSRVMQTRTINHVYLVSPDIHTYNLWLGWEASVSYKLNFYQRP